MRAFDFDGGQYAVAAVHQKDWGSQVIADLPLTGNETILDIGCGDGALSVELATLAPDGQVIGIDSSPAMIAEAKKHQLSNLSFRLMNVNYLNVEGQFDVVFSNAMLHWIKDHVRLLRSVYAGLRPGGMVRFNFGGAGNSANLVAVLADVMVQDRYAWYFEGFDWPWYFPSLSEYYQLVSSVGFRQSNVWGQNADKFFETAEAVIAWVDQPCIVPFIAQLPREEGLAFREEVINRLLDRTRQIDGRYYEEFRRINLFARK